MQPCGLPAGAAGSGGVPPSRQQPGLHPLAPRLRPRPRRLPPPPPRLIRPPAGCGAAAAAALPRCRVLPPGACAAAVVWAPPGCGKSESLPLLPSQPFRPACARRRQPRAHRRRAGSRRDRRRAVPGHPQPRRAVRPAPRRAVRQPGGRWGGASLRGARFLLMGTTFLCVCVCGGGGDHTGKGARGSCGNILGPLLAWLAALACCQGSPVRPAGGHAAGGAGRLLA
jgi:hypothetical protein